MVAVRKDRGHIIWGKFMRIIVEDGRCSAFANSYVSLADAEAYLAPRGLWPETPISGEIPLPETPNENDVEGGSQGIDPEAVPVFQADSDPGADADPDSEPEPAPAPDPGAVSDDSVITKKVAALIRAFDFLNTLKWKGYKHCWERIPAWPRENAPIPCVTPVEYIDPDLIPSAVIQAQCELAALIYNGHPLFAPLEHGGKVQSESTSSTESVDVLSESRSKSVTYRADAPVDTYLPSVYPLIAPLLEEVPGQAKCGFTVLPVLKAG